MPIKFSNKFTVYYVAAICFVISGLLSGITFDSFGLIAPGLFFGLALVISDFSKPDHKLVLFYSSVLIYPLAIGLGFGIAEGWSDGNYRHEFADLFFKIVDTLWLIGFIAGMLLAIILYSMKVKFRYTVSICIISTVAAGALVSTYKSPLADIPHSLQISISYIIWQLSVGLAIVYAYRNSFTENQPQTSNPKL